jgi:hypothetical protein
MNLSSVLLDNATNQFWCLRCSNLPFFSLFSAGSSPLPSIAQSTMADMDPESADQPQKSLQNNEANADIVDSMSKFILANDHQETRDTPDNKNTEQPTRRLAVYKRPQMLRLSKSPLVKPPEGMPPLKDWFGYGFLHICVAQQSAG